MGIHIGLALLTTSFSNSVSRVIITLPSFSFLPKLWFRRFSRNCLIAMILAFTSVQRLSGVGFEPWHVILNTGSIKLSNSCK